MTKFAASASSPWMCIGDFNELVSNAEAGGGAPRDETRMGLMRDFIFCSQLIDLGHHGSAFTWFIKRKDGSVLQERLNRALVNSAWCDVWPNTEVVHHPNVGSDHCPIVITCVEKECGTLRLFRFEEGWKRDPECASIVSDCWGQQVHGPAQWQWKSKLHFCMKGLGLE